MICMSFLYLEAAGLAVSQSVRLSCLSVSLSVSPSVSQFHASRDTQQMDGTPSGEHLL